MRSDSIRTPEVRVNGVIASWNPDRYRLSTGLSQRRLQGSARNMREPLEALLP